MSQDSIFAAVGVATAFAAVLATIFIGYYSKVANQCSTRISVIMHCNARYAELYKMKIAISSSHEKDVPIDKGWVDSYFRQYWGLKSDQIDYWLAGYVDPETLLSWFVSSVDSIVSGKMVDGVSYADSWRQISSEHRAVNPAFSKIIEEIISSIKEEHSSDERVARMHIILKSIEKREKNMMSILRKDKISFNNIENVYSPNLKNIIRSLSNHESHR